MIKHDKKTLCDLITGCGLEIIGSKYIVQYVDNWIQELNDPPYYLIQLSLNESVDICDIDDEYDHDLETLKLLLSFSVNEWENKSNSDIFIYSMQSLWYFFKFPDIMKEYYHFQETVTPHSDAFVSKETKYEAIRNYIIILKTNNALILQMFQ